MGEVNRDLVFSHHEAREHAIELVNLAHRLGSPQSFEPTADDELSHLVRRERQAYLRCTGALAEAGRLRSRRTGSELRFAALAAAHAHIATLEGSLRELRGTRKYRLACLLARPLDRAARSAVMLNVADRFARRSAAGRPPAPPGPYLVVGLGAAGIAAAHALADRFGSSSVRACDTGNPRWRAAELARLRERGVGIWTQSDGLEALAIPPSRRCIVKSPGIPFGAAVLERAAKLGIRSSTNSSSGGASYPLRSRR